MERESKPQKGIIYCSSEATALAIRRYNFEARIRRLENKRFSKPNAMDELLALVNKYKQQGLLQWHCIRECTYAFFI